MKNEILKRILNTYQLSPTLKHYIHLVLSRPVQIDNINFRHILIDVSRETGAEIAELYSEDI
jgi:hypothetical protein